MTFLSQSSRFYHPDYIRWKVHYMKFLLWSLFQSSLSSLLGPFIRLRILLSNILSLHSSLNIRDQGSQPYIIKVNNSVCSTSLRGGPQILLRSNFFFTGWKCAWHFSFFSGNPSNSKFVNNWKLRNGYWHFSFFSGNSSNSKFVNNYKLRNGYF